MKGRCFCNMMTRNHCHLDLVCEMFIPLVCVGLLSTPGSSAVSPSQNLAKLMTRFLWLTGSVVSLILFFHFCCFLYFEEYYFLLLAPLSQVALCARILLNCAQAIRLLHYWNLRKSAICSIAMATPSPKGSFPSWCFLFLFCSFLF